MSLVKGPEDERLIAQSVVDFTVKAGKVVDMATVTLDDIDAFVLDNVEAHNNYKSYFTAISRVYTRFWKWFTKKTVMVGAWYNDLVPEGCIHMGSTVSVRENWRPLVEMVYSDFFRATESQAWLLQEGEAEKKGKKNGRNKTA